MASSESKNFCMERLLCDSQRENIRPKEMMENDINNEIVEDSTKGMGQKRKTTLIEEEEGIQIKSQKMEQSTKTNYPQISQSLNSIPSSTVSTAQIPQKGAPSISNIPSFPSNILPPQPFPTSLLPPRFPFNSPSQLNVCQPHFPSSPIGHPIQFFPSQAAGRITMNPFLAALIHHQKIAQQTALLQQMFMMTPQSNLSTLGSSNAGSSSMATGSSGGNNSSINGTPMGFWNPTAAQMMMANRIGQQQNGQMKLAINSTENRIPMKENKVETALAANLPTPKNVRRGKNPTKVARPIKKEEEGEVAATCEHCGKTFARHWLLNGHVRTHTGEKPFECDWPKCGKRFADRSNCRAHERTHRPEKPFVCQNCGKSFKLNSYLAKHQNAMVCNKEAKMMMLAKDE